AFTTLSNRVYSLENTPGLGLPVGTGGGLAVGTGSNATGATDTAYGAGANVGSTSGTAVGANTSVTAAGGTAIGEGATVTAGGAAAAPVSAGRVARAPCRWATPSRSVSTRRSASVARSPAASPAWVPASASTSKQPGKPSTFAGGGRQQAARRTQVRRAFFC